MTIDQFVASWLGKKADWDGAYNGQCVDLARFYWDQVVGISQPKGVAGAKDFWTNYETDPNLKNNHEKIANTPTGVPVKGDIVIWNKNAGGGYGHISIFLEGDTNTFVSFDQNWPTLSKCTKTTHNYTNVLGWLHPKEGSMANELETCMADRLKFWQERDLERAKVATLEKQVADLQKKLTECENKPISIDQFTEDITIAGHKLTMSDGANVTIGNTTVNYKAK